MFSVQTKKKSWCFQIPLILRALIFGKTQTVFVMDLSVDGVPFRMICINILAMC